MLPFIIDWMCPSLLCFKKHLHRSLLKMVSEVSLWNTEDIVYYSILNFYLSNIQTISSPLKREFWVEEGKYFLQSWEQMEPNNWPRKTPEYSEYSPTYKHRLGHGHRQPYKSLWWTVWRNIYGLLNDKRICFRGLTL